MKSCAKCGHEWIPIVPEPLKCPACNQPRYWQRKVRNLDPRKPGAAAVVLGELPSQPLEDQVSWCGFTAYREQDGETMMCGLPKHHAAGKHGEWRKL
jgi:hypothetical protein